MRMTPEQFAAVQQKRAAHPARPIATQARGRATKPAGRMNQTEQAYADHLEARKRAGEIAWWAYEPWKFRLADKTFLTPDFGVMLANGVLECHEVKGYMEDDAAVKIKVAASQHWMFAWVVIRKIKGGWKVERFNS